MKKLTLTFCALTALATAVSAGTESYKSSKEMKTTTETPCPTWYADNEFNIGISGIYAPTANDWREDTYLGVDHAWGGAIDIKYFFARYFGIGVQGFGLSINQAEDDFDGDGDDENNFAGGVLGTFTFRYPIPCSRFAPYGWAGVGGIFGGGADSDFDFDEDDGFIDDNTGEEDARLMGQYGLGIEVRFTQHFGLTHDVSYNHLDGGQNDFWQIRTGLNFAF